jgi:plastocyanin domain-containing protein
MMDSFQIRKQIQSQRIEEISFTPTMSGQFRFYCPVNGMEGTLFVKELSTFSSDSPSKKRE